MPGQLKTVVGRGASKTVYEADDIETGRRVAWNEVRRRRSWQPLCTQSSARCFHVSARVDLLFVWRRVQINIKGLKDREIQRVVDEIKLMRTLKHPLLIKFYSAFTKGSDRIVFITELMTSGTLHEYVASPHVAHDK